MDVVATQVDPDRLKAYSFLLLSKLEGAVTAGMVHIGDRLGLYTAMREAATPVTSETLADAVGLDERWVREWLANQASAKLIDYDPAAGFVLSPEAVAVLAEPEHPAYGMGMFHRLPQTMEHLDHLPESFRTGVGFDYDSHGAQGAVGIERSFEPWYRNYLVPVGLAALDGVVDKLHAGAQVADVGCGAGVAICLMAQAFPASEFHGYDISQHALARARQRGEELGLTNASFHDARRDPLPGDHRFALVTTFDCIHDMTHPDRVIEDIAAAVDPDGTWLLVDIKARESFEENMDKNPMAALMYGISILSCMASALSESGGAGLGTLGLPESRARAMSVAAGFTRFRKLDIQHSLNSFFEIRP